MRNSWLWSAVYKNHTWTRQFWPFFILTKFGLVIGQLFKKIKLSDNSSTTFYLYFTFYRCKTLLFIYLYRFKFLFYFLFIPNFLMFFTEDVLDLWEDLLIYWLISLALQFLPTCKTIHYCNTLIKPLLYNLANCLSDNVITITKTQKAVWWVKQFSFGLALPYFRYDCHSKSAIPEEVRTFLRELVVRVNLRIFSLWSQPMVRY